MKNRAFVFIIGFAVLLGNSVTAQTVSPARQTVGQTEMVGFNLSTSIPEKFLKTYWTTYLGKYGKVRSRRGVQTLERAYIPSFSSKSLELTSTVSSNRNISTVFLAVKDGSTYVSSPSDAGYLGVEQFLKEFMAYATAQEELRLVKEDFSKTQDEQKKMLREKDRLLKEIDRTEKALTKLRKDLAKKEEELENYNRILESKQQGVKEVESKNK